MGVRALFEFGPWARDRKRESNHCIYSINFSEKGRRIVSEDRLLEWEADVR
jgi:hypothetical protein